MIIDSRRKSQGLEAKKKNLLKLLNNSISLLQGKVSHYLSFYSISIDKLDSTPLDQHPRVQGNICACHGSHITLREGRISQELYILPVMRYTAWDWFSIKSRPEQDIIIPFSNMQSRLRATPILASGLFYCALTRERLNQITIQRYEFSAFGAGW